MKAKKERAKSRREEEREKLLTLKKYTREELEQHLPAAQVEYPAADVIWADANGNFKDEPIEGGFEFVIRAKAASEKEAVSPEPPAVSEEPEAESSELEAESSEPETEEVVKPKNKKK